MIFVMGITMLRMDRGKLSILNAFASFLKYLKAKATWRIKLQRAFDGKGSCSVTVPFLLEYLIICCQWLMARLRVENGFSLFSRLSLSFVKVSL
jgi:hypothetical protein